MSDSENSKVFTVKLSPEEVTDVIIALQHYAQWKEDGAKDFEQGADEDEQAGELAHAEDERRAAASCKKTAAEMYVLQHRLEAECFHRG